jgi:hypothetical protein
MPASWMATLLDQEQIESSRPITPRPTNAQDMSDRSGEEVSHELGGRLLARYLAPDQVTEFANGSDFPRRRHLMAGPLRTSREAAACTSLGPHED